MQPSETHGAMRDRTYSILANPRRRYLLCQLASGERTTVDELVRKLLRWERDEPLEEIEPSVRNRLRISLVHNHLPRLDEHDVIEYAPQAETVVMRAELDEVIPAEIDSEQLPATTSRTDPD
ncbi:hypothetical protein ACLI4Z_00440 [Natrialbaceae archaeon A-arb3/5]